MTLTRNTLEGTVDLVKQAVEDIRENAGKKPFWVANSGGKDSGVIMRLMELAEVDYEAHHNFTTVDPPELVRHLLDTYPDTIIDRPKIPMLGPHGLIVKKGFPPTRMKRYCCGILKERGGERLPCRNRETEGREPGAVGDYFD